MGRSWAHPLSIFLRLVRQLPTYECESDKINPQSAVLGLHAIKDKPVAIDGKVEIRPVCSTPCGVFLKFHHSDRLSQMMFLALTYDHRLLDGREAVTFLVKVLILPRETYFAFDSLVRSG